MSIGTTNSSRSARVLAATLLTLAACRDVPTAPASGASPRSSISQSDLAHYRLATIEAGRFPALYIQDGTGAERVRVHFQNVADRIAGNVPADRLPVNDRTIWALGPARWSPDARQLAVIVSLGTDVSTIVVMDADGRNQRIVSPNSQVITGDIEWAPDSRAIAYAMSTDFLGRRPDLFRTDLVRDEVTRLTTTRNVSIWDEYRFDPSGQRVWFTQFEDVTPDGLNRVSRLDVVDLEGRVAHTDRRIVGNPQGLARDGRWALVLRRTSDDAAWEFVRTPAEGRDRVLARDASLLYAELSSDDVEAVLVGTDGADPWSGERQYALRNAASGELRAMLPVSAAGLSMAVTRAHP